MVRLSVLLLSVCALLVTTTPQHAQTVALKDVFKSDFLIGAALNGRQFSEEDTRALPIIKTHFNTITPENQLKWQLVHPTPDRYDFEGADRQ